MALLFWCKLVKGDINDAAQHAKSCIHHALTIIYIEKLKES